MIKKEMSIKRCLIAASMAGTMVLSSIPAVPVFAADAGKIEASTDGDFVYLEGYDFYTTAKVTATKIPSAEKWIRGYGSADVSNIKKASSVFFAKTPNPSTASEIVEVKIGALSTAVKYKFDNGFESKITATTTESGYAKLMIPESTAKTQYSFFKPGTFAGEERWSDFDDNAYWLASENGTTIYVRECGETDEEKQSKEETKSTTGITTIDLSGVARPTAAKAVKIPSRAKAPAAKIDYANHTITLKKGLEFTTVDEDWDVTASFDAEKAKSAAYPLAASADARYAVRTAATTKKVASEITYIHVSASSDAAFKDTGAKAEIVGEKDSDATLTIVGTDEKEAYQYAVVGQSDFQKLIKDGGGFDYSTAADKKTYKWKNVKTGKDKSVSKKIGKADAKSGNYVMVRKAAAGSTFSSVVKVFKAPAADGDGWKSVEFEGYSKTEASVNWSETPKIDIVFNASGDSDKGVFYIVPKKADTGSIALVSGKSIQATDSKGKKVKLEYSTDGTIKRGDKMGDLSENMTTKFTIAAGAIEFTVNGVKVTNQAIKDFEVKYKSTDQAKNAAGTGGGGEAAKLTVSSVDPGKSSEEWSGSGKNATLTKGTGTLTVTFSDNVTEKGTVTSDSSKLTLGEITISGNKATVPYEYTEELNGTKINITVKNFKNADGTLSTEKTTEITIVAEE